MNAGKRTWGLQAIRLLCCAITLVSCASPIPSGQPRSLEKTDWASPVSSLVTPTQVRITPTANPTRGISLDADLRIHPPAPVDLRVGIVPGPGVKLEWRSASPVTIGHAYSDEIIGYEVYRRTKTSDFAKLTIVKETNFIDRLNLVGGETYFYTVIAIHKGEIPSKRPDEVVISIP